MLAHLVLDRLSSNELERIPEPDLVMEDPAQVEVFMRVGREDGILAFTYFHNALHTLPLIRPGDTVLDLACGPANQLVQIARLNPGASFIGLDASEGMLGQAAATLRRRAVRNVRLASGDIRCLEDFADASIDVVTSTLSLHHLPDLADLEACFREIRRVLKPGGGLFLIDFGRFRRRQTQEFFATDRAERQPALFTEDYRNSLRAAFSYEDFRALAGLLGANVSVQRTWLAPFMIVLKSPARRTPELADLQRARKMFRELRPEQQEDFRDFARLFEYGGMDLPVAV